MLTWPASVTTLRRFLPDEARLFNGAFGLFGGVLLAFIVFVQLLGGNWRMAYGDDRFLTLIFAFLGPAGIGLVSPVWFWLGRPLWVRFGRPANEIIRRWSAARFVPGLLAPIGGVFLMFPAEATSTFWTLTLLPFGLLVGVLGPVWFWIAKPLLGDRIDGWLPGIPPRNAIERLTSRWSPAVLAIFIAAVAITSLLALPIVTVGEPVRGNGVTVSVTDTRTATAITDETDGSVDSPDGWKFLLVRVSVINEGSLHRAVPGGSVGDIAVIAPICRAQTFGEPANNCNAVFLDGPFTANGDTYPSYESKLDSVNGELAPGDRIAGWLVYRLESRPTSSSGDPMIVINEIGRWRFQIGR